MAMEADRELEGVLKSAGREPRALFRARRMINSLPLRLLLALVRDVEERTVAVNEWVSKNIPEEADHEKVASYIHGQRLDLLVSALHRGEKHKGQLQQNNASLLRAAAIVSLSLESKLRVTV